MPLRELLIRVEDEHRYDLAYVPFDYPDDWHPFALAARARPGGGRARRAELVQLPHGRHEPGGRGSAARAGAERTPAPPRLRGKLAAQAAEAGKLFNESPAVHPAVATRPPHGRPQRLKVYVDDTTEPVNPRVLNPTTLFQGVARWRLE